MRNEELGETVMNWLKDFDWQTWVAVAIVALAAWSLVKRFVLTPKGCGSGCSSCPNAKKEETLVQIGKK